MPIYMDMHILPGVKAKDVANAHLMDVMIQKEHSCTCMTYWIDEARGHVFCLIDAPAKEVVTELHNKAHGLVPHRIIEVEASLVESFLGRVSDPEDAVVTDEGLKLINDPSYRFLVLIKSGDPVLLQCLYGKEKAKQLLQSAHSIIQSELSAHQGKEVEHAGLGFIASFASARNAFSCAMSLQQQLSALKEMNFRIGISGGEPVMQSDKLFGDTIQLAERMCFIEKGPKTGVSSTVNEVLKDIQKENTTFSLSPQDEELLGSLFKALDENWQESDFDMEEYCRNMAMSRSQLYRKTMALTGYSPNTLLKEFRLEKAKELLKKKAYNISQLAFDAGFSSPSYFTKCFKKKYDILPLAYLDMLHHA